MIFLFCEDREKKWALFSTIVFFFALLLFLYLHCFFGTSIDDNYMISEVETDLEHDERDLSDGKTHRWMSRF